MGTMFRSEDMTLAQLFIQPEAAYFVISELGETGAVQFKDLNGKVNVFQRKFVNEVRRCDEMERKLRYIENELNKDSVNIPDVKELPKAPNPREIIDLEAHLEKTEGDIKELTDSAVNLKSNFLELTELRHVLEKSQYFFNEQEDSNGLDNAPHKALIPEDSHNLSIRGRLGFVAGVINRGRVPGFERMLWRISRGNVFLRQAEIEKPLEDPATGNEIYKTVFVAFFQGEQLKTRIKKVCAGYHASMYPCPSTLSERTEMLNGVKTRLEDLKMVLNQTQDHRQRVLNSVAKELQNWTIMVKKMKAIYHVLNFFNMDVTKKCLIGECWVPSNDIPVIQKALSDGSDACGSSIPSFLNVISTTEDPPTFNRTNKFTRGFQNLIDAYGVASYREANPALYTIITFPFLFAVMFGDAGHAIIILSAALYLILSEKKLAAQKNKGEIFDIFFGGRYIMLLMGCFSFYTGLIYNDMFSKSLNIFGSSWNASAINPDQLLHEEIDLDPVDAFAGTPYFFGVDPAWQSSKNKIVFLNSFKMKLSIIFGVLHMIFGVCMSVVNFVHFKQIYRIFVEFLPQLIFLCCLFLWMVVMMFIKWIMFSAQRDDLTHGTFCAPSVLIFFIDMMLMSEPQKPTGPGSEYCEIYLFSSQDILQKSLLGIAFACIPVLLFGKPVIMMCLKSHKRSPPAVVMENNVNSGQGIELDDVPAINNSVHHEKESEEHEESESFGEVMVHQCIHTIEYVLSTVSHTASYLRLWALSLAHAQLSEVLWSMMLNQIALRQKGYIGVAFIYIIFALWAFFTIAILVLMEGLSAFLHTLRLHWVEFMSKFYIGLGYPFQPFSLKNILDTEIIEEAK